tara:strand:- start:749 stop:1363 length:615 start_codon:yes stop_codon:yes gene_type:complete
MADYIIKPDSGGNQLILQDDGGGDALTIETDQDVKINAGNVVIGTAGKGVDFSQSQTPAAGMTAEILDSYEEGTWTPNLTASTVTWTYNGTQNGYYTKIGNVCFFSFWFDANYDSGTTSNTVSIQTLPFTSSSSTNSYGVVSFSYMYKVDTDVATGGFLSGRIEANTARLDLFRNVDDSTPVTLTAAAFDATGSRLIAGGFYFV